jgi:hypothetical protein
MDFKFVKSAPGGRIFPIFNEVWGTFEPEFHTLEWSAVELNGKIISIGGLLWSNPQCRIQSLATTSGRRRIGAATFLLQKMHELHSPTWGDTFEIWCDCKNTAAIGLVEKAGYAEATIETVTKGASTRMVKFVGPATGSK